MKKYYFTIIVLLIIYISVAGYDVKQNNDIQEKQDQLDQIQQEIKDDLKRLKDGREDQKQPEKTITQKTDNQNRVLKKEWTQEDPRQNLINYAYNLGGKDFVLTLEGENGLWTVDRRSMIIGKNGHYDYGLCQLNTRWHGDFVRSDDFQDPYKQLDYCFGVWQDAIKKGRLNTTFYAYNVRNRYLQRFTNLK